MITVLDQIPVNQFDVVVHLGAGGVEHSDYTDLAARRIVLIDGSEEAVSELRALSESMDGKLEVLHAVVAAESGPVTWNRYNLPWLDGIADATGLEQVYPRLRSIGHERRNATALSNLCANLGLDAADTSTSALVVDLPGQEDLLLTEAVCATLESFGWILVRYRTGTAAQSDFLPFAERLTAAGYDAENLKQVDPDVWPVKLFRRATRRLESELRERLSLMEATQHALTAEVETLRRQELAQRDALAALACELDEARRTSEAAAAAKLKSDDEAAQARTECDKLTALARTRADDLEALRARESEHCDVLAAQGHELDQARRDLEAAVAAKRKSEDEIMQARKECDSLKELAQIRSAEIEALRNGLDEQKEVATELHRRLEENSRAIAAAGAQQSAVEGVLAQVCADRDAARTLATAHAAELETLRQEVATQRDTAAALQQQLSEAGKSLEAATARQSSCELELADVRNTLAAEQARAAELLNERGRRAEAEGLQWQTRQAQLEEELKAARELLADRDARQRLLDTEILRVEAQLELVKDVLLREKNF